MFKNYMEQLVEEQLKQILMTADDQRSNICRCEDCIARMRVSALNRLTPLYGTDTMPPPRYLSGAEQLREQVSQAVAEAEATVSKTAHQDGRQPGMKAMQSLTGMYGPGKK